MSKTFKGVLFILLLACVLPGSSCAESGKKQFLNLLSNADGAEKIKLYTAFNLFTEHGLVRAINFRVGDIIPLGTPVKVELIDEYDQFQEKVTKISFTTLPDKRRYTLDFTGRYHPGKSIYDYANLMFGSKTFNEMTAGSSPDILSAINRAAVIEGMNKDQVLLSYGYPAEHRTSSLRLNTWVYWKNRRKSKKICFDVNERAISCSKQQMKDL